MTSDYHSSALCETLLSKAFPFHLVITDNGNIVSCGNSLEKALPTVTAANSNFFSHFSIQNPSNVTHVDQMPANQDKLFILQSTYNPTLLMRGQLISFDDSSHHVFLISPWVTDIETLDTLGFTLNDFALHNSLSDFLILVQAQRTSLNDSRRLSSELSQLNTELEDRVSRRTNALEENAKELIESKRVLEQEMSERQRVEIELRHAQKLEAVGQLAAGIAHEINTPMQYIGNSLQFLQSAFSDLQNLSTRLEESIPLIKGHEEQTDSFRQAIEEADLEYIRERAPKALDRALQGINRVTQIVGAMNEFSHPDQREKSSADLNRALSTTLTVASNEYKYVATVDTQLQPLSHVECHLGDLNQVFLNLIVNAAHAISEGAVKDGVISIKTWQEKNVVKITIADNGSGIPEIIQHRIFDPFFTTKEVGRGTGQGLSISHKIIVENHGGQLSFTTEPGVGTTFHIELPVSSAETVNLPIQTLVDGELAA